MRRSLAGACLLVIALLAVGCARDGQSPSDLIGGNDSFTKDVAKGGGASLVPGGYYSPCENVLDLWFTELMWINRDSGQGTVVSHLNMLSDPEFGAAPTVFGLAFDLDGALYTMVTWPDFVEGHEKSQLARVDVPTGVLTYIGPPHNNTFTGTDFDAYGNLYASGFEVGCPEDPGTPVIYGDGYLHRIDKYTGATTPIGPTGVPDLMDLAFDSQGTLWGTVANKLYTLSLTTGTASYVMDITGVEGHDIPGIPPEDWAYMEVMSIAFDEDDVLWATAMKGCSAAPGNSPVMRVDTQTGAATIVGYTNQPYNHGGDICPTTVRVAHRKGESDFVCIEVSLDALPAHLAHGDFVPGTSGHAYDCP